MEKVKKPTKTNQIAKDKKRISMVVGLLFLAGIMCGFIIWQYFSDLNYVFLQTNNHVCVYPLDEFNKIESRYNISQFYLLLLVLICGIAAAIAVNVKIPLVRFMFIAVTIILIVIPYILINNSTQKAINYYNENKYILHECP